MGHLIKAWSKTQAIIAKSSAESELYALVKGACESLGTCTLLRDFGEANPRVRLHIDASAAKGIVERKGLSKVRHIDVDVLWPKSSMPGGFCHSRSVWALRTSPI